MTTLLIDDLRSFRDHRDALVARTSAEGLQALERLRSVQLESLWLDHDLGVLADGRDDTIMACIDKLAEYAFEGQPLQVRTIYVHTSNPVGRDQMLQTLKRWDYNAVPAQADDHLVAYTESGAVPQAPGETRIG